MALPLSTIPWESVMLKPIMDMVDIGQATVVIMALPLSTIPWESVMLKPIMYMVDIGQATVVIMALPLSTIPWESVMLKPIMYMVDIGQATVVIMALSLPTIPWESVMLMLNRNFPSDLELQAIMATMAMLSLVATRDMNETDTELYQTLAHILC